MNSAGNVSFTLVEQPQNPRMYPTRQSAELFKAGHEQHHGKPFHIEKHCSTLRANRTNQPVGTTCTYTVKPGLSDACKKGELVGDSPLKVPNDAYMCVDSKKIVTRSNHCIQPLKGTTLFRIQACPTGRSHGSVLPEVDKTK